MTYEKVLTLYLASTICMNTTDVEVCVDPSERDLDLAVKLVNTCWLVDPSERAAGSVAYQRILTRLGDPDLARHLSEADLPGLLALGDGLAPIFAATTVEQAVNLIDPLLRDAVVPVRLGVDRDVARWAWARDLEGMAALRARLLAAVAAHLVRHGTTRLGVCQADPCRSVYVDRSRARTRRYCRDQCNDRAAAAAYRKRRSG